MIEQMGGDEGEQDQAGDDPQAAPETCLDAHGLNLPQSALEGKQTFFARD